jgi:hypothetical protein
MKMSDDSVLDVFVPSTYFQYQDYCDSRPYYCGCKPTYKFKDREDFRRHMKKHGIMIPFKAMKRKVDAMEPDDGVIVLNEFKRYYTNLFLVLIDYLTNLKL